MKVFYQWIEFPVGNRAYGGGGWSRKAKSRPAPVVREGIGEAIEKGKSLIVAGQRKLKLNAWCMEGGHVVRRDYPDLVQPAWLSDPVIRAAKGVEHAN